MEYTLSQGASESEIVDNQEQMLSTGSVVAHFGRKLGPPAPAPGGGGGGGGGDPAPTPNPTYGFITTECTTDDKG